MTSESMEPGEQSVLVVGEELARVDRFVAPLRRANYSVRRLQSAHAAGNVVRESPIDLIVVVLPLPAAREMLEAIRAEGSPCRRSAVLLVTDESLAPELTWSLGEQVNRILPATSPPEELMGAAELLLRAAPRVSVGGTARLHRSAHGQPLTLAIDNLSSTGMLLMGSDPPPAGSVVGFELAIPSVSTPIRGQAEIMRHTPGRRPGECGVAANFVSLGGEGAKQLERVISRERAAAGAREWRVGPSAASGVIGAARSAAGIRDAAELAVKREELAELEPFLEELLQRGLVTRAKAADWYVTAAELGLESLAAFSAIMEAVHSGRTSGAEVSQQIADLSSVRKSLAEFADVKQGVQGRIRILIEMRRALGRLLRALALTGAMGETEGPAGARPKGLVAELALDIQRLLRSRQLLGQLMRQILDLQKARYVVARGALRERAAEIRQEYAPWAAELGLDDEERLLTREGRKKALAAADRELRKVKKRLPMVHEKIYTDRFRSRVSGDMEADFAEAKLIPILVETLAAGSEFLLRAYSAYRHALELTGTDPRLLDRVAGLAASVAEAEQRLEGGTRPRR